MKQEAWSLDISSQMKQYRFIQCHIFGISLLKWCHAQILLHFAIWYYYICEAEAFRFREPKTAFTKPCFNFLTLGIYAYAILKDDTTITAEDLRKDLKDIVRQKIGSFAIPEVIQVFFDIVVFYFSVFSFTQF